VQGVSHDALGAGLSEGARRAMAVWLGGCAAWVFSMVVLGGLTRLTRSGLSMTTWKFTGERAPSTLVRLAIWMPSQLLLCVASDTVDGHPSPAPACRPSHLMYTSLHPSVQINLCMQEDWEAEFAKYKASPEYQKVNR
jgi:hypothetical protein